MKNQEIKVLFFSSSEFGIPSLTELLKNNFKIVGVVTQPDRPKGRRQILKATPIKELAQRKKIEILQPEILDDNFAKIIKNKKPDLIVLTAYKKIIPGIVLDIPRLGCLNLHPSLLPKYRGASPIQFAILNRDRETGVTIIKMDEKIDHGPILIQKKIKIEPQDNYITLNQKLSKLGAKMIVEIIPKFAAGEIKPYPQKHSEASYTKVFTKEDGAISWNNSAQAIEQQIRAFLMWPETYTFWRGKRLIIKKAEAINHHLIHQTQIGEVFATQDKKIGVICARGEMIIKELQPEGKRKTTASEFLHGYPKIIGSQLS